MKLKDYIRQRELRMQRVERGFVMRMRRALRRTIEPVYDALQYDLEPNVDTILKPEYIREALRWLYVKWGYEQALWFSKNFEYQKKNDVWMIKLESWFEKEGAEKVTAILGTTKDLVKPALKDAVSWAADGLSIDKIQKAVKDAVEREKGAMSMGRARTIARTEVLGAANNSTHQVASDIGGNLEKRWITGGLNVRATHQNAEAQGWIPFNEPFIVGGYEMQHPHDPAGGVEEIVNCKCVEVFRTIT